MSVLDRIGDALRTWLRRPQPDGPETVQHRNAFTAAEADAPPAWMDGAASESMRDESTIPTSGHGEDQGRCDSNGRHAVEEKSPAQTAEELKTEYFRQMTLENTPLGFYDDRYDMDDFPEEIDPAPSNVAEQALLEHLREHPELRDDPAWSDWYEGVDETAGDDLAATNGAVAPTSPAGAPPNGGTDRDRAQPADETGYHEDEQIGEVAADTQETAASVGEACAAVDEALASTRVADEAPDDSVRASTADAATDC